MSGVRPAVPSLRGYTRVIGSARGVNLAATGDQGVISIQPSITKYVILQVILTNASATPVLAQIAVYTGAVATGTTIVAAGTITGAVGSTVILSLALAGTIAATALTAGALYVNVAVANATALTADIYITATDLS
jgi:hypothetical protein